MKSIVGLNGVRDKQKRASRNWTQGLVGHRLANPCTASVSAGQDPTTEQLCFKGLTLNVPIPQLVIS